MNRVVWGSLLKTALRISICSQYVTENEMSERVETPVHEVIRGSFFKDDPRQQTSTNTAISICNHICDQKLKSATGAERWWKG
jgi:hypothetical protein